MADGLTKTADSVHGMAEDMARSQKSASSMEFSFARIGAMVGSYKILGALFDQIVKKSELWIKYEQTQAEVFTQLDKVARTRLAVGLAAAAALADLWRKQRQLNQDLIEANSTYEHRNRLMVETLVTQTQTGISFDKMTEAARALVSYNMDSAATFDDNLRIVAKLDQGLGIAVSESARLASVVERQVHGSFKEVAKTLAEIVEYTSLAGDEAARLALSISTSMGRLGPGMNAAALPDVVRLVGRYEGALKEIGGQPGAFQELINNLTTTRGMTGAGMLRMSPNMLATEQGMKLAFDRFAVVGKTMLGNLPPPARFQALEQMGEIFGISADQANQMLMAIESVNTQQMGSISLQERWKNQISQTNSGITRLSTSILGLLQTGLLPAAELIGYLTNKLADFVEWLLESKTTVQAVGYTLAAAVAVAALSLANLARQLWKVAAAAVAARVANVGGGALATSGEAWSRREFAKLLADPVVNKVGWVKNLVGAVSLPMALLGAAVVGSAVTLKMIYDVNKQSLEEQKQSRVAIIARQAAIEARSRAGIYGAARFGTADDLDKQIKGLQSNAVQMFQSTLDPAERRAQTAKWLGEMTDAVQKDVLGALVSAGGFTPLTEMTPQEFETENKKRALLEEMVKESVRQRIAVEKDIRSKLEQQAEADVERSKTRWWNYFINDGSNWLSELGLGTGK